FSSGGVGLCTSNVTVMGTENSLKGARLAFPRIRTDQRTPRPVFLWPHAILVSASRKAPRSSLRHLPRHARRTHSQRGMFRSAAASPDGLPQTRPESGPGGDM